MDRLTSILIGVDFSDSSVRALEQALRMARWNDARSHAFHVVSPSRQAYIPTAAGDKLASLLKASDADDSVTSEVIVGVLLDETLRLSRERSVDLLAIGAFGPLGQFTGSGVGAFAAQCMRHAPCKVLAVHHTMRGRFRRVLAAVDFSPTSARALQTAMRLVRQEQGELHVLYVPDEHEETVDTSAQLESMVRDAAEGGSEVDYRCVVGRPGDAGEGIILYARKIEAHLIALGTRGKTDLQYVLAGSTCDRVLRAVRRSVLVAKPDGFVPPAER